MTFPILWKQIKKWHFPTLKKSKNIQNCKEKKNCDQKVVYNNIIRTFANVRHSKYFFQSRRISDERSAVERRYTQQIEQLTTELGVQWETTNKLQLELDKQRRENGDLRRECAQKQALIDELKKDMQSKISE